MKRLLPIDELNRLSDKIRYSRYSDDDGDAHFLLSDDEIVNEIFDFLLLSYTEGARQASVDLDIDADIGDFTADIDTARKILYKPIGGKTWEDRIREYLNPDGDGTVDDILGVIDTEMTRDFNGGGFTMAHKSGATRKKWNTILDGRERDTHFLLNGEVKPIDDYFYSISGDRALYPGDFTAAEENCGCRCILTYSL